MFNYRHPDPRRVWKVGSEQQWMTPLPLDLVDCRMNSERLDFVRRRGTREYLTPPGAAPGSSGGSGQPWVSSGRPWASFGRVWGNCTTHYETAQHIMKLRNTLRNSTTHYETAQHIMKLQNMLGNCTTHYEAAQHMMKLHNAL